MAAKLILALAACLALSQGALVRRDAPAGGAEAPNLLADLQKNVAELGKTFSEQLTALTSSQNAQDFQKTVKEGSDSVLAHLTTLTASLQAATEDATGKAKEALQTASANLQKTTDELRKAHPEVEQQATAVRDQLQAAFQNTVQETQKLAQTVGANLEETNKKVAPKLKEAYDVFVKEVQQVQQKISQAANKQ